VAQDDQGCRRLLREGIRDGEAWGPLEIAVEMLITAGESGKCDDIDAATKQVEIVLRGRRLI
jgi:hypothetical protein